MYDTLQHFVGITFKWILVFATNGSIVSVVPERVITLTVLFYYNFNFLVNFVWEGTRDSITLSEMDKNITMCKFIPSSLRRR